MLIIYLTLLVFSFTAIAEETEPKYERAPILHRKTTILFDNYYYRILGEDSNGFIYDNEAIRFNGAERGSGVEAVTHYFIENPMPGPKPICYDNRFAHNNANKRKTTTYLLVDLNQNKKLFRLEGLWGRQASEGSGKVGDFACWSDS